MSLQSANWQTIVLLIAYQAKMKWRCEYLCVVSSHSQSSSSAGPGPCRSAVCSSLQHHWDEPSGGAANPQPLNTHSWGDSEGTNTLSVPLSFLTDNMLVLSCRAIKTFLLCVCHVIPDYFFSRVRISFIFAGFFSLWHDSACTTVNNAT